MTNPSHFWRNLGPWPPQTLLTNLSHSFRTYDLSFPLETALANPTQKILPNLFTPTRNVSNSSYICKKCGQFWPLPKVLLSNLIYFWKHSWPILPAIVGTHDQSHPLLQTNLSNPTHFYRQTCETSPNPTDKRVIPHPLLQINLNPTQFHRQTCQIPSTPTDKNLSNPTHF